LHSKLLTSPSSPQHASRAPLVAIAATALFMAFIGLRVHYVWIDEVAYAEAAIN
jgi:hypothetical protein